jgi:heat shock protein HslJ
MSRSAPLSILAGAFLLVSTIGSAALANDGPGASPLRPDPSGGIDPVPTIQGTDWLLVKARLSGAYADIPEEVEATLRMVYGQAGGSGGCNQWSAPYTLDGQALTFGPITSTLMLCTGPGGDVETFYLADLEGVAAWELQGTTLVLTDDSGEPVLAFEPKSAGPALDGDWLVTAYNDGQGHLVAVGDGSVQVSVADGRISGTAGCNSFMGEIVVDANGLAIGPLMATKMACQPQELMDREAAVMAALQASTAVSSEDASLALLDAAGTVQVQLVPVDRASASPAPSPAA